ncbi:MAG: hypothetical protein GWO02_07525, partial [Gammaproteobacteria bacterium]|nr:hypothetical protein [Gammaproteobacteria bacterium]
RMLRFDDEAAQGIQGEMARVAAVVTVALGICIWMDALGLERDAHKLSLSAAMLLSAVLMGVLVHRHRKAVAG